MRALDPHKAVDPLEEHTSQERSYVEKALGLVLLLILAAGCAFILRPFLAAILLAIILCVSTWSLFQRIERWLGGRRTLAALLMTLMIAVLLVVPLAVLGNNLAENVARLSEAIHSGIERGLPPPDWLRRVPVVGPEAERVWIQLTQQGADLRPTIAPYITPMRDWAFRQGATLLTGTLQLALSVVLAFFLYRDGTFAERRLETALNRVGGWRARHVLQAAAAAIAGVVNGVLVTALVQAILLGISLRLAGIPGAFVLGALAMILTLVPLGLLLIWAPAALWLISIGEIGWAVYIVLWNGLFVGSLDNILRPYLISRGIKLPTVLILLGVLGGVLTFGVLGVFIGPVLLTVSYTLIQDWERVRETED